MHFKFSTPCVFLSDVCINIFISFSLWLSVNLSFSFFYPPSDTPYCGAIQPLWRFLDSPTDGRLLIYRSDDIKNLSRTISPKVCGYVHADNLLPQTVEREWQEKGELCCLFPSLGVESHANTCGCLVKNGGRWNIEGLEITWSSSRLD